MKTKVTFFTIFFLGLAVQLMAQQNEPLLSVLSVFKITVDDKGNETAEETTKVTPGDTLEYRLKYTNNDVGAITMLKPILPIPVGMEFIKGSPIPAIEGASVSNTGNDFQSLPLTRQIRQPNGTVVTEEVPVREYRRLQWMIESLDVGESVILVARVKVIDK